MFNNQIAKEETLKLLRGKEFKISFTDYFLFGFCFVLIVLGVVLIPIHFLIEAKTNIVIIIASLLLVIGVVFLIYSWIKINKQKKHNISILEDFGWKLHEVYFNYGNRENEQFPFSFDGLVSSDYFNNLALSFHHDQKTIKWHISEDIETRTRTTWDSKGGSRTITYKVYILKYRLENWLPNLENLDKLTITRGKVSPNSNFFQSESIEFNERYQVTYKNQLQLYHFFNPKLILDLIQQEEDFLKKHKVVFEDGLVSIDYRSKFEKRKSNCPDFLDWSHINWLTKKSISRIIDKIELDFNRFFDVQNLLLPFDLDNKHVYVSE